MGDSITYMVYKGCTKVQRVMVGFMVQPINFIFRFLHEDLPSYVVADDGTRVVIFYSALAIMVTNLAMQWQMVAHR